jgi:transcriptional regulator with XRE-family HTH domain
MIAATAKIGGSMGRPRTRPTFKRDTPRRKFVHRLHDVVGRRTFQEIADVVGVSRITVSKWFSGDNLPDLDYWPKLAKALGLKDWRDLLPPS